nr:cellulase family glycosylhydrolase [Kineosporia babensis]
MDAIATAGFDCVRLPVRWWGTSAGALDELVGAVVEQALQRDLAVVLSMHHADGLMTGEPEAAEKLTELWTGLARRFAGVKDPRLAFDLLNEPRDAITPAVWNALLPTVLAAVRAEDASRAVIVGGARMSTLAGLLELEPPADQNLAVTLHYYEPFAFTHQGAHWEEGADAWTGTRWLGGESNARGNGWPGGPHWADAERDRRTVTTDLSRAAAWAQERGLQLLVGEFGAYEKAPWADRVAWTGWVRAECERLGLGWAHWDFATDFGVYDPATQAWRPDLLHALTGAQP